MGEHHHGVSTSTMPAAHGHGGARTTPTPTPTPPPKIKIIHIVAPEIIKTDVANFRDLVQRLTGKPACATTPDDMAAAAAQPPVQEEAAKKRPAAAAVERSGFSAREEEPNKKRKIKCEVKVEEGGFGDCDLWMDLNPGGFLSFLEEEEEEDVFRGMMMAPDHDFLQPFGSSARMDLVGEMYAS